MKLARAQNPASAKGKFMKINVKTPCIVPELNRGIYLFGVQRSIYTRKP
jgi:hypothetical protein